MQPMSEMKTTNSDEKGAACEKTSEHKTSDSTEISKNSSPKSHRKIVIAVDASSHSERALRW